MVELHVLADREVEFVAHEMVGDMPAEIGVAGHAREIAQAETFVGLRKGRRDAEREGRIGVEGEMIEMIVVDDDDLVGLYLGEPALHRLQAVVPDLPARIELSRHALVVLVTHRGRVRHAETADDLRHHVPRQAADAARTRGEHLLDRHAGIVRADVPEVFADGRRDLQDRLQVTAGLDQAGPVARRTIACSASVRS